MSPIIQKCIEELNAKEPKLDYVKGLLEAALMMSGSPVQFYPDTMQISSKDMATLRPLVIDKEVLSDEDAQILSAYEKGPIGKITT